MEINILGGQLDLPEHEIIDGSAFCEVIFFYISPKNPLGNFFYRFYGGVEGAPSF